MNSNLYANNNYQMNNRSNKSKSAKKSRSNNYDPVASAVPIDRSRKKFKSTTDYAVGHNQMRSTQPMSSKQNVLQNRHASPAQSSSSSSSSSRSSSCSGSGSSSSSSSSSRSRSSSSSAHSKSNAAQAQNTANNNLLLAQIGNWDDELTLPARPLGLERGLALEKILKSFKMRGETYLVVKWKSTSTLDAVALSGIIELYPHIVIEYFEKLELRCPTDDD